VQATTQVKESTGRAPPWLGLASPAVQLAATDRIPVVLMCLAHTRLGTTVPTPKHASQWFLRTAEEGMVKRAISCSLPAPSRRSMWSSREDDTATSCCPLFRDSEGEQCPSNDVFSPTGSAVKA
jgi:hypothetical protein